jgi:penicillin G amidase
LYQRDLYRADTMDRNESHMKKTIKRVSIAALLLLLSAVAVVAIYIYRSVPDKNAAHHVAAPIEPINIALDATGIALIEAKSERDLYFAVGFMHARDRLWQLEVNRRVVRGELAEMFGAKALDTDKFLRTLGVRRAAEKQFDNLPKEIQAHLQAYADGVNAYVRDTMSVRPPEFVILGIQPGLWEPSDSVGWSLMMAYDLSGNWGNELLRFQLASKLSLDRINELLPVQPGDKPLVTMDYVALYRSLGVAQSEAQTAQLFPLAGGMEGMGSNNWVVHGDATVSGKPLLANDPHLTLNTPALWYFAKLRAPGIEVTGATLPGMPSVVLGRTKGAAWGFTNTGPDVQDLYLEETNSAGEIRTPSGWAKPESRSETIKVKGEADTTIVVRESRHGPIISDIHAPTARALGKAKDKYAIAMRWAALDADNTTAQAAFAMNKSQTVAQVKEALRGFLAPQQNIVIADTLGNAAFIAAGRVPVRKPENDLKGQAPAPGWDAKYDWNGWLPFEQLPQTDRSMWQQPFLATANQRIHGDDYAHFIAAEWAHKGRFDRITELLAKTAKHDAQSLREIQHDLLHTHDVPLLAWVEKAKQLPNLSPNFLSLLTNLSSKPTFVSDGSEAQLMWAWQREVTKRLLSDDVGATLFDAIFGRRDFRVAVNGVLARDDAWWCDDKTTPKKESCDDVVLAAFAAAISELTTKYGSDPTQWNWSEAHVARGEHRPFSNVPLLAKLFEVRVPTAGDTYSVMVGKLKLRDPEPYLNEFAASLRAVYDLSEANANAGSIIFSTGQSGNPFSPHYRDLAQRWGSGGASSYVDLRAPSSSGAMQILGRK